jgi:sulfur relay (sulfurtransferase) complex TusBCD TusD component (DsrE family)
MLDCKVFLMDDAVVWQWCAVGSSDAEDVNWRWFTSVVDGQVVHVQHCLLAAGSRQQLALAGGLWVVIWEEQVID